MLHWSKGPPGVLCVQHAEGGVVAPVVHGGSAGFVQKQNVSPLILHWSRTNFLQALKSAPDKPAHAHAAAISSAHGFEPQSGGAALGADNKPPRGKRDDSKHDRRSPSHPSHRGGPLWPFRCYDRFRRS